MRVMYLNRLNEWSCLKHILIPFVGVNKRNICLCFILIVAFWNLSPVRRYTISTVDIVDVTAVDLALLKSQGIKVTPLRFKRQPRTRLRGWVMERKRFARQCSFSLHNPTQTAEPGPRLPKTSPLHCNGLLILTKLIALGLVWSQAVEIQDPILTWSLEDEN